MPLDPVRKPVVAGLRTVPCHKTEGLPCGFQIRFSQVMSVIREEPSIHG